MQEKLITVEIDESGNSSIDLEGFHGRAVPMSPRISVAAIPSPNPTRSMNSTPRRLP
jgi:hypothetical protein